MWLVRLAEPRSALEGLGSTLAENSHGCQLSLQRASDATLKQQGTLDPSMTLEPNLDI
jgi:hypothetical protein